MKKRILSLLILAVLLFSLMPADILIPKAAADDLLSLLSGVWQYADMGKYYIYPDGTYSYYTFDVGPDSLGGEVLSESGTVRIVDAVNAVLESDYGKKDLSYQNSDSCEMIYIKQQGVSYAEPIGFIRIESYAELPPTDPDPGETEAGIFPDYASVIEYAIANNSEGLDGGAFLYDANEDGVEELFLTYIKGFSDVYGMIYTMRGGKAVPILADTYLCVLAGMPFNYIGVISINGTRYVCAMGGVTSTEVTYGTDSCGWWLYSVEESDFPPAYEISWRCSFQQQDSDVGRTYTITSNGVSISNEEYEALISPIHREKCMCSQYVSYWVGDTSDYESDGIYSLKEMLAYVKEHPITDVPPEPAAQYMLRAYSSDSSYSVAENKDFWFDVRLIRNGEVVHEWDPPALVVSNSRQVASAEVSAFHDYAYRIHVQGFGEGLMNLMVTDTASGACLQIPITVYRLTDGVSTFFFSSVPTFYPDVMGDRKIETNFYNFNGIYINNFRYTKESNGYHVALDAYNSSYCHGAIDIYDAAGKWADCYLIEKYADPGSIRDSGEYIYRCVEAVAGDGLIAYTSGGLAKHSSLSFTVPEGGYFTISNNFHISPGTVLYNCTDFSVLGLSATISALASTDVSASSKALQDSLKDVFLSDPEVVSFVMDQMADITLDAFQDSIFKDNACKSMQAMCAAFEESLNERVNFPGIIGTVLDLSQAVIEELGGPFGWALAGIRIMTESSNYFMQVAELSRYSRRSPLCIRAPLQSGYGEMNGVSVEEGTAPEGAVLQAFRIYDADVLEWFSAEDTKFESFDYIVYNICFVKDDRTVSADGKVRVKIKAPEITSAHKSFFLYRQEADGSWTNIKAEYRDGYIIFETDHFSNYVLFYRDDPEPSDEPGTEPDSEPEPETEPGSAPETEPGPAPETEPGPAPETEPLSETTPEAEHASDPDAEETVPARETEGFHPVSGGETSSKAQPAATKAQASTSARNFSHVLLIVLCTALVFFAALLCLIVWFFRRKR